MSHVDGHYVVLAVEDDPDHATLIQAVFACRDASAEVKTAGSGEEAIQYLLGGGPPPDRDRFPLPDVIVLDLTMPGMGGVGFLEWLNNKTLSAGPDRLAQIPVVVFTSSEDPEVAWRCFSLGAREVKVKPSDFDGLVDVVHRVLHRWQPKWSRAPKP